MRASRAVTQIRNDIRTDKAPRQSRSRVTREKIFAGVLTVLEREGASGLTVRGVARESGLSTGAIYNLFSSISSVLYHLYEERLEQELAVFRETFGCHEGECTLDQLLDTFLSKDAELGWGKPIDLHLEEAVRKDPSLERLCAEVKVQQRDYVAHALRQHEHNISRAQIRALASYIIEILNIAYELRHKSNLNERQYLYTVTRKLLDQVMGCLRLADNEVSATAKQRREK